MRSPGVRHLTAAAFLAAGVVVVAAACGIDFPGSAVVSVGSDAGQVGAGDGGLPASCATIDASCLGTLPDMWKPMTVGAPACPAAFAATTLVTNPKSTAASCACGECRPVGSFTCTGVVEVSGGDSCNDDPIANAVPGACTSAHAQHLRGAAPTGGGTVDCVAPNDAGTGASTDPLVACIPSCAADFCASPLRCVMAEGEQTCPAGFQLRAHAGIGADPGCAPCACEAGPPGSCRGSITAYASVGCADAGIVATYALDTCNTFPSGDYDSVRATLIPPDASCVALPSATLDAGGTNAEAGLVGTKTICCQ